MSQTIQKIKDSTSKYKLFLAVLGVFLCGAWLAYWLASVQYAGVIARQAASYDRQIARLQVDIDDARAVTGERLDRLLARTDKLTDDVGTLVEKASGAAKEASKAAKDVKDAANSAAKANVRIKEYPIPPVPKKPPPAIVPYQEPRIEP